MTEPADDFIQRLAADANLMELHLASEIDAMQNAPARLKDAMRHGALGGGKRFRPFLVLECATMLGAAREHAAPAAAAIECIHCYSLVHDDLPAMDNDQLRRGRPTVWAAFDEWTAILAGDALLTLAFEIIARPTAHTDAGVRSQLALAMAQAAGAAGMVGGQCLDLESDKLGRPAKPDATYIRHMQSLKTGALLRFACEAGAILASAGEDHRAAMQKFGSAIGSAFQIADDLLDIESTPEALGKATGKDEAAGKATLVALLGVDEARARLETITAAALDALAPYGAAADLLRAATHFVARRKY
ncbi:MAG: polyprenyl synthetase family protein [Pseudomonadota bacterium]